jgi:ABC-type nitrate/sulfonate/bicarbonate transport system permease component
MTWLIMTLLPYPELKNLPTYTLSTIARIIITLALSVLWGVSFGILAATNRIASLILTPLIDLLQSVPILGYFPILIAFLFALGPWGIELSVIVLLFASMAWAIFFGVVGAIRGIPSNVTESARSFGLTGWRYIRHVILPAIVPATVSGANLAWCDGWFFIIAAEYVQYQGHVVTPPSGGLGYLLAQAAYEYKDMTLAVTLLVFITFIVVYFNTLTWHRLMEKASTGTFKPVFRMDLSGVGKLGIARALALKPDVLLMDEPFSSLDELTAKTLRELVLEIWRDLTLPINTFIMVSHNVEEAVFMADRIVVMSPRPGKVIGEIKVDIPRPRSEYLRDKQYFQYVDEVVSLLEKGKAEPKSTGTSL